MRAAVVGAGYAGLAVTWHLLQKQLDVTVFDGGEGASHVSTGLLHPAPGRKAVPIWRAEEGMQATLELLEIASLELPVYERTGILRIAATDEQRKNFGGETLWMPDGITVFSRRYLTGLKKACQKAKFQTQWIQDLAELDEFDLIVLTTGAETLRFFPLPLKKTIGQCLICRWPERLSMSLLSQGHITPTEDPELCLVGSTYEHTDQPDPKKALELLDKAALFYPPAKDFKIVEICSGVRIAPQIGYKPVVEKVGPKTWVFTGLGSRGLIYHALFAKSFSQQLLANI
jgi:glycine/D-amino acid oxidase-like deaminating enzyme